MSPGEDVDSPGQGKAGGEKERVVRVTINRLGQSQVHFEYPAERCGVDLGELYTVGISKSPSRTLVTLIRILDRRRNLFDTGEARVAFANQVVREVYALNPL